MDPKRENGEFTLEEIMEGDYESDEVFSLESILAEYKSNAYIDGDKKTPKAELEKKADEIVREVTGRVPERKPEPVEPEPTPEETTEPDEAFEEAWGSLFESKPQEEKAPDEPEKVVEPDEPEEPAEEPEAPSKTVSIDDYRPSAPAEEALDADDFFNDSEDDAPAPETDEDDDFFDSYKLSEETRRIPTAEINSAEDDGDDAEGSKAEMPAFLARLFSRRAIDEEYDDVDVDEDGEEFEEEEEEETPDIPSEIARFSAPVKSLTMRILGAGVLCAVMLVFTMLFEGGKALPFGIGESQSVACGVLMILQLVVMLLGIDTLITGFDDLVSGEPGAESLVLISCLFSIADGFVMLVNGNFTLGLPFSLVSAVSLLLSMHGSLSYFTAMRDSLKVYTSSSAPYGVISEQDTEMEREVLKKFPGRTEKFYSKLMGQDVAESVYRKAAPLLILAAFLLALLATVGHGQSESFAHCFSVMTAVSASFPAVMCFSVPFACAIGRTKNMGCAVAGWEGACDIFDADSALITDVDVFPAGTVSLSGVKLFEGADQRKAILYTSSLIIASESGLSRVFAELLRSQGFVKRRVESFACYEGGGIGGLVDGERIIVGSGAFMNLMGIRVPDSLNVKNSVFTAINGDLSAVFTINYIPANSVQNALNAILNTRVNVMLAVRDFNVTPNAIQQKFKVSMEGVELIPIEKSYELSEEDGKSSSGAAAVLSREGLAPMAEAVTRGKLLKTAAEINTLISVAGAVLGLILMFFLCWTASYASASAGNAFIFMSAVALCVILFSQTVKKRL